MTPQVDLEAAGLVVHLITAGVGAGEVASLSEVCAVVGEQGTEGDEGLLTPLEGDVKQGNARKRGYMESKATLKFSNS